MEMLRSSCFCAIANLRGLGEGAVGAIHKRRKVDLRAPGALQDGTCVRGPDAACGEDLYSTLCLLLERPDQIGALRSGRGLPACQNTREAEIYELFECIRRSRDDVEGAVENGLHRPGRPD